MITHKHIICGALHMEYLQICHYHYQQMRSRPDTAARCIHFISSTQTYHRHVTALVTANQLSNASVVSASQSPRYRLIETS